MQIGGEVVQAEPADEVSGEGCAVELVEELAGRSDQTDADGVRDHESVEQPCTGAGHVDRLGEHFVQLEHLDAAIREFVPEIEVIALGLLDPEHVVEEQVVGVGRCEPLVGESRCGDQHFAQSSDLGVHSVCFGAAAADRSLYGAL